MDIKADINADIKGAISGIDRGEEVSRMEPLLLSEGYRGRAALADLSFDLVARSVGFRRSIPPGLQKSLSDLVRSMNCYYSNLIEGHNTHPVEIERASKGDYSQQHDKRDLQLEARAHIEVQRWIDHGGLQGREAYKAESACEIHRRFCELLPVDLLWVEDPVTHERHRVEPGKLRTQDVKVGQLVAISPGAIPRFLQRMESVYTETGKAETVLAAAAAHHRFLWIHPFLDGNGRVARLISHSVLLGALETGSLWSVARGLARNVAAYKGLLSHCDRERRNALDGRGALSEEALGEFTRFFLTVCLDQVEFMEKLIQPDRLRMRIVRWADEEIQLGKLPSQSGSVLEAVLYRGELPRGEVEAVTGTGTRQARRVVSALIDADVLESDTVRSPLRLKFPATLAQAWMPGLFPEN